MKAKFKHITCFVYAAVFHAYTNGFFTPQQYAPHFFFKSPLMPVTRLDKSVFAVKV